MVTTPRHLTRIAALCAAVALIGAARPALADERDVSVGGVYICTITHDASGYNSYQRAVEASQRITNVLSNPAFRQGGTVAVNPAGTAATVTVGGMLVFTVTPADVSPTNETPFELAKTWGRRLAQGLAVAMPGSEFHF